MRYERNWRLTDRQRFAAVAASVVAVFLTCMSVGLGSIGLFLVAVLIVVGAGAAIFLLGLRHAGNAYVSGKAHVIRASRQPAGVIHGRCEMQLLLEVPGMADQTVSVRDPNTPVIKWPRAGMVLPVDVAPRNLRQLRVRWDRVLPNHAQPVSETDETIFAGPSTSDEYADPATSSDGGAPESGFVAAEGGGVATMTVVETVADPTTRADDPSARLAIAAAPATTAPTPATAPDSTTAPDSATAPTATTYGSPTAARHAAATSPPRSAWAPTPEDLPTPIEVSDPPADDIYGPADVAALDEIVSFDDDLAVAEADLDPLYDPVVTDALDNVVEPASPPAVLLGAHAVPQPRSVPPPVIPVATTVEEAEAEDEPAGVGIMLIVSDLDQSVRFYRDNLGFTEIDTGVGSAVLAYGGGRILLRRVVDMSPVDRRVVHLHLEVADVDAAYMELRRNGVEFVHRPRVSSRGERLELWAATFRDPDGHAIALTQWRAREDLDAPVS